MQTFPHRLSILLFSLLCIATCALPQSTLTQIEDTVYNPDGSLFNGTVVITWLGSTNPSGSSPAPNNTSVHIYNGALSVLLVPSTTATPPANYQAVYNSSDGLVSWTEFWQVAPSSTPLTLREVRVPNGGTPGSGGTTSGSVAIAQVTGLAAYLSSLDNSVATLTAMLNSLNSTVTNMGTTLNGLNSTVTNMGTTLNGLNSTVTSMGTSITNLTNEVNSLLAASTSALFQDRETPSGSVNGSNATFTLANTPATPLSLTLFRNGVLQASGTDYSLSGVAITFASHSVPHTGDVLLAYYRLTGTGPASIFIDDEIPQGTINGSNVTFALSQSPNPGLSLKLFKNGDLLQQNTDYTLSGSTITFVSQSATPQAGDALSAYYRTQFTQANPGFMQANPSISANRGVAATAHRDR